MVSKKQILPSEKYLKSKNRKKFPFLSDRAYLDLYRRNRGRGIDPDPERYLKNYHLHKSASSMPFEDWVKQFKGHGGKGTFVYGIPKKEKNNFFSHARNYILSEDGSVGLPPSKLIKWGKGDLSAIDVNKVLRDHIGTKNYDKIYKEIAAAASSGGRYPIEIEGKPTGIEPMVADYVEKAPKPQKFGKLTKKDLEGTDIKLGTMKKTPKKGALDLTQEERLSRAADKLHAAGEDIKGGMGQIKSGVGQKMSMIEKLESPPPLPKKKPGLPAIKTSALGDELDKVNLDRLTDILDNPNQSETTVRLNRAKNKLEKLGEGIISRSKEVRSKLDEYKPKLLDASPKVPRLIKKPIADDLQFDKDIPGILPQEEVPIRDKKLPYYKEGNVDYWGPKKPQPPGGMKLKIPRQYFRGEGADDYYPKPLGFDPSFKGEIPEMMEPPELPEHIRRSGKQNWEKYAKESPFTRPKATPVPPNPMPEAPTPRWLRGLQKADQIIGETGEGLYMAADDLYEGTINAAKKGSLFLKKNKVNFAEGMEKAMKYAPWAAGLLLAYEFINGNKAKAMSTALEIGIPIPGLDLGEELGGDEKSMKIENPPARSNIRDYANLSRGIQS